MALGIGKKNGQTVGKGGDLARKGPLFPPSEPKSTVISPIYQVKG
jgi:hypothetical protein